MVDRDFIDYLDDMDDTSARESEFCRQCGVTLEDHPGEDDGFCHVCMSDMENPEIGSYGAVLPGTVPVAEKTPSQD